MRRPTTSTCLSSLAALLAVSAVLPAAAGAQSYDDPLLSGYGGPGAGEQSLFGGELLPSGGGGGSAGAAGPAVQGAPRTATGDLELSTARATGRPPADAGASTATSRPSGSSTRASSSGQEDGDAAAPGSAGGGSGSKDAGPVLPMAETPTQALERVAAAGSPVSLGAFAAFAALLALLTALALLLRGTDPAPRA